MSNVIWLMYLADVVGSLSAVLGVGGILLLIGYFFYRGVHAIHYELENEKPAPAKARPFVVAGVSGILIASFMPSQTTIYAAAAVSAGDAALNTETGSKAVRALNAWLDKQIADAGKEEK